MQSGLQLALTREYLVDPVAAVDRLPNEGNSMIDLIRLGDTTDHGGEVITASETMRYGGRRVARKGDLVKCPLHPDVNPNVILEGDAKITDRGIWVARQGHHATCGCALISSIR